MAKSSTPDSNKTVARNRKARHLYHIVEVFEAGLELKGTEVKSLRAGKASLAEAYARSRGTELFLEQCHIPPYEHGNINNVESIRPRKLLLHRREIDKLIEAVARKGAAIVPLSIYFKSGRAKVQIALATGKKDHDKREDIKKRDTERDMQRAMRERSR